MYSKILLLVTLTDLPRTSLISINFLSVFKFSVETISLHIAQLLYYRKNSNIQVVKLLLSLDEVISIKSPIL